MRPDQQFVTAEQAARRIGGLNAFEIIEAIPGATTSRVDATELTALIGRRHKAARERIPSAADYAYLVRQRIWPSDSTDRR